MPSLTHSLYICALIGCIGLTNLFSLYCSSAHASRTDEPSTVKPLVVPRHVSPAVPSLRPAGVSGHTPAPHRDTSSTLPSTLKPLVIPVAPLWPSTDAALSTQPGDPNIDGPDNHFPINTWPLANPFPFPTPPSDAEPYYPGNPGLQDSSTVVRCDPKPVNLWGLESQKLFRSPFCASPVGGWQAYTEMAFVPAHRQTTATLFLLPMLPPANPRAMPPRPRTWWERHLWDKLEPLPPPPPDFEAMNQDPAYLQKRAIPLLKLTFQPPFEFSTLQVEAWSPDGTQLWVVQKTGLLHAGWTVQKRWHLDLSQPAVHARQVPLT